MTTTLADSSWDLGYTPVGYLSELFHVFETGTYPQTSFCYAILKGCPDVGAFGRAVRETQREYPGMASVLGLRRAGLRHLLVRVRMEEPPELELVGASAIDLEGRTHLEALSDYFEPLYTRRLDLFREPPARFFLVSLPDGLHALVGFFHHVCTDGATMMGAVRTLLAAYHEAIKGQPPKWARAEDIWSSSAKDRPGYRYLDTFRDMFMESRRLRGQPVIRFGKDLEITSPKRHAATFCMTRDQTRETIKNARKKGLRFNDFLSISVIRTIDEILDTPEGILSFWMPVNLRHTLRAKEKFSNYTTAINVDLLHDQRVDERHLAESFVLRRTKLMMEGRDLANLALLKKLMGTARFLPVDRRTPLLRNLLRQPKTFLLTNVGVLWPKRTNGKVTQYSEVFEAGGLEIVGSNINLSADIVCGHTMAVFVFNGRLHLNFSFYSQVMERAEGERFLSMVVSRLLS
jgi:NRPS condensation-like uncharacterized protein